VRRCFVISPIGPEGSAVREHADDVFDYIIQPAMAECGIAAFRSDHLQEPGKITEQMFREILNDDLSIAILTGHNPNVFYELAVAHAAGRPVIVLLQKGESLPFDIGDIRCVQYDLKPRSLFEKTYVQQIVAHVRALEANGWQARSPFGQPVLRGGERDGVNAFSYYVNGNAFGTPDTWQQLLRDTKGVFEILGIHLGPWRGGKGFSELVTQKAAEGCAVRVLIMHPDNPTLAHMINETLTEVDLDDVTREINEMAKYFARLAAKEPNLAFRQIVRGTLHCQTTRTDDFGVYLPYLYSRRRRHCPLWQCKAGSAMYEVIAEEFEGLWRMNAPAA